MKTIELENIVRKEDKYFVAQCLNVEVSSFGESKEEALTNLQEALELYFEDLINLFNAFLTFLSTKLPKSNINFLPIKEASKTLSLIFPL